MGAPLEPDSVSHYDFSLQALAKLERGYAQDLADVTDFLCGGYVTAEQLRRRLAEIEPELLRYPAVDPVGFRRKVEEFLNQREGLDGKPS